MAQIKAGNISKGLFVIFKGAPHQVTKTEFVSPGKGSAFVRCRLKHAQTGTVQEFTYKTNEMVEHAEVEKKDAQYSYRDGNEVVFMNPHTFEQMTVPLAMIEDKLGFITEGMVCSVLLYQDQAIGIKLPAHVNLKVTYSEDAVAGNRVNAPKKPVTLETGMIVQVPLFIKVGDVLTLDTDTGEYLSRAN